MKAPKFWFTNKPQSLLHKILIILLSPLSHVYKMLSERKQQKQQDSQYNFQGRVICVGNLIAGGGGKTPTALYLMDKIQALFPHKKPAFLTRGFGGKIKRPHLVDLNNDTAQAVGDEALLLAQKAPTIVSKNRAEGAKLAEETGYDLLIMDDGFQNESMGKDIQILVVDGRGFGNENLLPAGPLRETIESGLAKADIIIATETLSKDLKTQLKGNAPLLEGSYRASLPSTLEGGASVIGFAGIANPDKFHKTLEALDLNVIDFHALGDHEPVSATRLKNWLKTAEKQSAKLVTTEKDYARLSPAFRENIIAIPVELILSSENTLNQLLKEALRDA